MRNGQGMLGVTADTGYRAGEREGVGERGRAPDCLFSPTHTRLRDERAVHMRTGRFLERTHSAASYHCGETHYLERASTQRGGRSVRHRCLAYTRAGRFRMSALQCAPFAFCSECVGRE